MFNFYSNFFSIGAGVLSAIGLVPYIFSIIKGQTKPSGASWWTWTLINLVTIASSWFAGASWQVLVLPVWLCVVYVTVAVLSIKYGDNNWDSLNKYCVAGAFLGIVLWLLTGQPLIALGIAIVTDILASIPNFRHVFRNPEQENKTGWFLGWLSSVFEMLAMNKWSLAESGWPLYFFINMSITLFLIFRRSFIKTPSN